VLCYALFGLFQFWFGNAISMWIMISDHTNSPVDSDLGIQFRGWVMILW
jgi:hypothetical protein